MDSKQTDAREVEISPGTWGRIESTLSGEWIALVNGWQVGGPMDHGLGCGTARFDTAAEAWAEVQRHVGKSI